MLLMYLFQWLLRSFSSVLWTCINLLMSFSSEGKITHIRIKCRKYWVNITLASIIIWHSQSVNILFEPTILFQNSMIKYLMQFNYGCILTKIINSKTVCKCNFVQYKFDLQTLWKRTVNSISNGSSNSNGYCRLIWYFYTCI